MFEDTKKKLDQSLKVISEDMAMVRTGRAQPSLVENVSVEAYPGTWMKVQELAAVSAPDPKLIMITPWDNSTTKKIEQGIFAANIGLSPVVDGNMIRIVIPALTEDRRKELVKSVKQKVESGKTILRDIRTDAKKEVEGRKGQPGVSEDDIKRWLEELQKLFDSYTDKVDEMGAVKEKELMSI